MRYAYEILVERGHVFTEEQVAAIQGVIHQKEKEETIFIHDNHRKASYMLFLSAGLSFIFSLLMEEPRMIILFSVVWMVFLAFLVNRGADWVKYILLVGLIMSVLSSVFVFWISLTYPILVVSYLLQIITQIIALVLLFNIPKSQDPFGR